MKKVGVKIKGAVGKSADWGKIAEYTFSGLNEYEKAHLEKTQKAAEEGKKAKFILGEPIIRSI
jgi:hypothetical protein